MIYNIDDKVEDKNIPRAVKTEHSMTAFKTSMLPQKRSMYESLYKGNLNRFHQSDLIEQFLKENHDLKCENQKLKNEINKWEKEVKERDNY